MRRWLDPEWYRYLRWRIGPERRRALAIAAAVVPLAFAGFFAMRAIASSGGSSTNAYVPLTTTVTKLVRVREHGRVVLKRVPVIKKIYAKPVTVDVTRTVHAAGGTKVVTTPVVRYKPVYRRRVVTVRGKLVTVARIVTNTRMLTDTQLLTATDTVVQRVTTSQTSTVVRNQTQTQTQTVNQTLTSVRTETLPPETVTVRAPRETVTQTVTTTAPAITVTVQVP